MSYTPYLIAAFSTGVTKALQPWLVPDESQIEILDGFVYRGVWQNRPGYTQFADGESGGVPNCESRMVRRVTAASMVGTIDGANKVFTKTTSTPLRRGTVTVNGSNPVQALTDNGLGVLSGAGTGTVNYTTGVVSVTFTTAPAALSTVTVTYDYHPGLPVMGVMTYYTATSSKELIVADTTYVNRYNPTTNRLDDITPTSPLSGTSSDFLSWTNYSAPDSSTRLLFVNGKDAAQRYNGTTVTPYPMYTNTGTAVLAETFATGNTTTGPYAWVSPKAVLPGSVTITDTTGAQVVTDGGFGTLGGAGSGTIDYLTGTVSVTFLLAVPAVANNIKIDYTPLTEPMTTCDQIFQFQDRLIVLSPTINSVYKGKSIYISGFGQFGDIFSQDAIGAGFIDISDNSFINSADYNRDDLIIFSEESTWSMKYSGNDAVPFSISRLDSSRGTLAPFGTITYLNATTGLSPRGIIACDGYTVERSDDKIPSFSFDDIDIDNFGLCFAGKVDQDRDHYLIYPSEDVDKIVGKSDKILITNYEEFNYSTYRIPLSCMGNFYNTSDVTWNDLLVFDTWEEMSLKYSTWESFLYQNKEPIGIGGGHHGQITALNQAQAEDYPVRIRAISGTSFALTVTTDYQEWRVGDIIYLTGLLGAVELNNKQGQIVSITSPYVFVMKVDSDPEITPSTYTADTGLASKVIKFSSTTKQFNPFANTDNKVRCGWLYMYATTTGTALTDQNGDQVDAILNVRVIVNDTATPTQLNVSNSNMYKFNLTNRESGNGSKKWNKIWINQVGRFIQFELSNSQAGANIEIHALIPGFAPIGRLL